MKILVFADTHGNNDFMLDAINSNRHDTDLIIHLGNNTTDFTAIYGIINPIASICIIGNCDYPVKNSYLEHTFNLGTTNIKAFACHGHTCDVNRNLDTIYEKARINRAKIAFYGHTHIAHISERNGIYIINPGSCSLSRSNEPCSYGIIRIENKEILPSIIYKQ